MDNTPPASSARPQRHLAPHVRSQHVRIISGREVPVRSSIVNVGLAARQHRLSALTRALQLSNGSTPRRHARSIQTGVGVDFNHGQMDLVVELARAMLARGAQILDEGLSKYARLTMPDKCYLAMARVRVSIAEAADQSGSDPRTAYMREDLARMENLLFVESLQRLDPDEAIAVRDVAHRRHLERLDAQARASGQDEVGHGNAADERESISRERNRG